MKRAIWRQVALEKKRNLKPIEHTQEGVKEWLERNEFGLTLEQLSTHCVSKVPKNGARDLNRMLKNAK